MTKAAEALLEQALSLPDADRANLAGALRNSLEAEAEEEVESAWRQEVAARVAALDAGEVETVRWEEVRERLLTKLA